LYTCEKFQLGIIATIPISPASSQLAIDDGNPNVMMEPAKAATVHMGQLTGNSTARGDSNESSSSSSPSIQSQSLIQSDPNSIRSAVM